jgi:two-component system, NtrC family, sensor kinase
MRIILIIITIFFVKLIHGQSGYPDSLKSALIKAPNDSVRYSIYTKLAGYYDNHDRRTSYEFNKLGLEVARKNNMKLEIANSLGDIGYYLNKEDRYGEAFKCYIEGIHLAEDPANELLTWTKPVDADPSQYRMEILAWLHHDLGLVFRSTGNNLEAIHQFRKCKKYLEKALPTSYNTADMNIGAVYLDMNILDSALFYQRKELNRGRGWRSVVFKYIGDIHFRKGNSDSAFIYYHRGLQFASDRTAFSQYILSELSLAQWHLAAENKDSSLYYSNRFLNNIRQLRGNPLKDVNISNAYELLYQSYQLREEPDSMMKYLQLAFISLDSISKSKIRNLTQYQNITFEEQIRLEELEKEKLRTQSRIRIYSLLAGLVFILIVAFILFRNARQKHKANTTLKNTLENLKATQAQLIQSEKMASLGELTAGIAHEIQNPLNFVNNFSEVSSEMIEEMKEELAVGSIQYAKGNTQTGEAKVKLAKEIADDIKQNLEKINHHGKRADAIVKGMLQHSRTSTGQKEPTDINALADEYLRLSYHGLRAKEKSFNVDYKTDFDPDLPRIDVVPQDIGRVLLNLINNAFYACAERLAQSKADESLSAVAEKSKQNIQMYKPEVIITTNRISSTEDRTSNAESSSSVDLGIEISVKDNGSGIPYEIKDKIFQPFFTTKPTGQGTGLGLSLSYDIVKAHGGEINFSSSPGGTIFKILLNK